MAISPLSIASLCSRTCFTESEIAADLDETCPWGKEWAQKTISNRIKEIVSQIGKDSEITIDSPPESFQVFNLWSFQKPSDDGEKYPGRMPGQRDGLVHAYRE